MLSLDMTDRVMLAPLVMSSEQTKAQELIYIRWCFQDSTEDDLRPAVALRRYKLPRNELL